MSTTTDQPLASNASGSSSLFKVWLPVVIFGVLWADLVRQLSYTWEVSEQYAYGWFVPFFALALFWRRWLTRPAARPQTSPFWLTMLVAVVTIALLPIRVIFEINPDWPLFSWMMASSVVGISLYAVYLAGGRGWVGHFAFPICFILVSVQWPYRIEHGLIQGLMRVVAGLTVELLGWFDIPAFQHGNLIEISNGMVGIDEACSGIRSFQATLMAALFLGELYQLSRTRRLQLLFGGVVTAFCLNVVRTVTLTWRASSAGLAALERWHDPAGLMIFSMSFACLWLLAAWLRAKPGLVSPTAHLHASASSTLPSRCMPRTFLLVIGCWSVCILAFTEAWYRSHDVPDAGVFHWSIVLPEANPTFQTIEMAPRTRKLLAFDFGATGKWEQEDGSQWTVYMFRWRPRSVEAVIHSRIHRPGVCLPASGLRETLDAGIVDFYAGKFKLPFRRYTYESGDQTLYVFFCQWEDGDEKQTGIGSTQKTDRLQSALAGRRFLGQQTLEIILTGCDSLEKADADVRERLPELIQPDVAPISGGVTGKN